MKKKAVFNWSGGKDSAHALYKVIQSDEYEIIALLTTVNSSTYESTMHHIPISLLEKQSISIGLPLYIVNLTPNGSMNDYQSAMRKTVMHFKSLGVTHFIYGDIYLNDVRYYREELLKPYDIELFEPLWGKSSNDVILDFLETGLKTVIVTTMDDGLGSSAIGKTIDQNFIGSLPDCYDPNGENGEYHSFCYDGPIFSFPIQFNLSKPYKECYEIGLDDGSKKIYSYWFGKLSVK